MDGNSHSCLSAVLTHFRLAEPHNEVTCGRLQLQRTRRVDAVSIKDQHQAWQQGRVPTNNTGVAMMMRNAELQH